MQQQDVCHLSGEPRNNLKPRAFPDRRKSLTGGLNSKFSESQENEPLEAFRNAARKIPAGSLVQKLEAGACQELSACSLSPRRSPQGTPDRFCLCPLGSVPLRAERSQRYTGTIIMIEEWIYFLVQLSFSRTIEKDLEGRGGPTKQIPSSALRFLPPVKFTVDA